MLNHWLNNEDGKWETVKLGEVLNIIEAGKSFRCNEKVPALHEKGIIKISAVTWGDFKEDECKTIINEELYNPQYRIHKGDLLISRANTIQLVGNCVLVKKEPARNIMLSDKVLRLVPNENTDSEFLLYSLKTSNCRTQIQVMSTGNQDSMRNIGQDRIRKIEIPLPPLSEQQRIVEEIESRLSQASTSSACIEEALQQTEALRQSILKKAFSGELIQ
ncbi:MAG: restriction endonuclease subunit S [Salinivirgaceae bacterium]|nr:restriction endonuclease subunit S [Salinivirgaceae bacterium]